MLHELCGFLVWLLETKTISGCVELQEALCFFWTVLSVSCQKFVRKYLSFYLKLSLYTHVHTYIYSVLWTLAIWTPLNCQLYLLNSGRLVNFTCVLPHLCCDLKTLGSMWEQLQMAAFSLWPQIVFSLYCVYAWPWCLSVCPNVLFL